MNGLHLRTLHTYRLCESIGVRFAGAALRMESELGTLTRKYKMKDSDTLEVTTVLRVPRRLVAPGEIKRFNRFFQRVLGQTRIWFGLEPRAAR